MLDAATLAKKGEIAVGEHPNAMVLTRDGARLFVACANTNAVWVVDVAKQTSTEQIAVSLGTDAPPGSTPNGLALSPDGRTLAIANADNNTVTLADVSKPGATSVSGWIPTGWYPTGVLFDRDGSRLFVLDGKGLTGMANPRGPQPGGARTDGSLVKATLAAASPCPECLRLRLMARQGAPAPPRALLLPLLAELWLDLTELG